MTGAATGIGAATAAKLKALEFEVTALDIVEPSCADQWIQVDMSEPQSIDEAVLQLSGTFDCLINNAGLPPRPGLEEKVLAVNFLNLVRFSDAVLPLMAKGGAIVNTASKAGFAWRENIEQVTALLALPCNSSIAEFIDKQHIDHVRAYNLSKEAVIAWTMSKTKQLITMDLRMNCVSPAAVSTGILDDFATAFGEKMERNVERVGRPGTPEEVADVIVFLCGQQSAWLKGNDVVIDGGMSAIAQSDQFKLPSQH